MKSSRLRLRASARAGHGRALSRRKIAFGIPAVPVFLAALLACILALPVSTAFPAPGGTAPGFGSAPRGGSTPRDGSPQTPYWLDRSIPGAASPIASLRVAAGNPRKVSAVVEGSSFLYSSADGGANWQATPSTGGAAFLALAGSGTPADLFYALDSGRNVYRSGAGASWRRVGGLAEPAGDIDVGSNPANLVAATGGPGEDRPPSYSLDSGETWTPSAGTAETWSIAAGDPTGPDIFYAARQAVSATPLASSADGGASWADCGAIPSGVPIHATAVAVFPNGGPVLVGTDTVAAGLSPIYRSNDGGGSWAASSTGIPAGEVVHAMCVTTSSPTAYAATGTGIYASYDGGTTWADVSANLPEQQYTSIAASGGSPSTVFAGAADGSIHECSTPYISRVSPEAGSPGDTVTIDGLSFGGPGEDSYVSFAGVEASSYLSWTDTRVRVRVPGLAMTGYLRVVTPQGTSNGVSFTIENPAPAARTWYLAEGCTGSDGRGAFETWVLVQNPGKTTADVAVTFMTDKGPQEGPVLSVPPDSRQTLSVADYVPGTWSVSTMLASESPVIAERSVYWNAPTCYRQAATDSIGVTSPANTWYLAEGCTGLAASGAFETWILVQNPSGRTAAVALTYMTPEGPVDGPAFDLAAYSRQSVDVSATLPNCWSVSTRVTSSVPVVAERSMYLNTASAYRQAATDSIGVQAGAQTWYLAEGSTGADARGSFETWVLVQNPGQSSASVSLTYMTPQGAVEGPTLTLPAMSRESVNVADKVPGTWDVSTKVTSDRPVIAERAIYWSAPKLARQAATDSVGVTGRSAAWCLAEGCTGVNAQGSFETWVLVQNPGQSSATVSLTYMTPDGAVTGPTLIVEPDTRRTVNVAETVPGGWDVSTRVTSNVPVIVERAMYWNSADLPRQAAHDSIGVAQ